MTSAFDDVLAANAEYSKSFSLNGLSGHAARGLAVVTCMDSRIEPLEMLGLAPGDAKILRNAGARVTDDVLRTLALAVWLLGVKRVLIMPHTDCRMSQSTEEEIHELIQELHGVDTWWVDLATIDHPLETLRSDVRRVKAFPMLPADLEVEGFMYDVRSGRLTSLPELAAAAAR
jgi:carbonic anhydrase